MHVSTDTVKNVRPGPVPQRQKDTAFHQLTRDLNSIMAHSPGSDFSDIDPQPIISLMEGYASKASDWLEYAYRDKDQCFTRNLVDRGNGKCNLMLQGSLKEVLYDWPDQELLGRGEPSPLQPRDETLLAKDEVTYIADSHGLHKISNPDPSEFAVSLHLYAPPNAAKYGCQVFDEKNGQATHVVQYHLFSEMGVINDRQP